MQAASEEQLRTAFLPMSPLRGLPHDVPLHLPAWNIDLWPVLEQQEANMHGKACLDHVEITAEDQSAESRLCQEEACYLESEVRVGNQVGPRRMPGLQAAKLIMTPKLVSAQQAG